MTHRQIGDQAWRWNPSNTEAAGHLTAMLDTDGVDFLLSGRREDGIALTITTHGGRVTALPGDWLARTPDGDWSVIDNPDHTPDHRSAHAATLAEVTRQRALIGRITRLHNTAIAECRGVIRVAELGHALNQPPTDNATNAYQEGTSA